MPHLDKYALVVDPIVDNFRLTKVLMDGGSSLNILYEDTLKRMNLAHSQLDYSKVAFHGIVPGRQAKSMGSIKLDVTFGPETNYHMEAIRFEVVPFKSAYHAIFGRPALMTHKYRGSQQSSREVKPKFIDSTQGEPKNIYKS